MAIIKVVKRSGKTYTSLKKVLSYVGEKAAETYGINCNEDYKKVAYEFFETKNYFNKTGGRQYRHYIQSFSPEDEISKEKILEIAIKWAEKSFHGHEVFIAIHDDKDHLHSHFIVNTVNFENGKKLHEKKNELELKKDINDKICLEYGIDDKSYHREIGTVVSYAKDKYYAMKKGGDITKLTVTILDILDKATSIEEFITLMAEENYKVEWNENKKHVVFKVDNSILEGKKNKFRLENLRKTFNLPIFTKEGLLNIFQENLNKNIKENINISTKPTRSRKNTREKER